MRMLMLSAGLTIGCASIPFVSAHAVPVLDPLLQAQESAKTIEAQEKSVASQVTLPPQPTVSPETTQKVLAVLKDLESKGFPGVQWRERIPLGVQYVEIPLKLVTAPGAASYSALLPIGALSPTAPTGDPNKAPYFILKRSVGPVRLLFSDPIRFQSESNVVTGIKGVVTIGPMCGASRSGCPDQRYEGTVIIKLGDRIVAELQADHGEFAVSLSPGAYEVEGKNGGPLPRAPDPQTVTIVEGQVTSVGLRYDSGIR